MEKQIFRRSSGALSADVGDDFVALNIDEGQCYGMESVTATVWALLAEPRDLQSICSELLKIYEISPEQCRSEVAHLLEQFQEEGLIESNPL